MNCIPSFYLLITPWQYYLKMPFSLPRTLCAKPHTKKSHATGSRQASFWNSKTTQNKWSHSQASACLTQSFHAVFFNISHEPNPSPAWCYYLEITQSICLWFQRIFALNTWFFLCLHLIHHEPCHLSFSVTQIHIIHIYSWVISFSNLYGTLGRGGTSLTNKRQQNTKYWPFQLK